jgi:DNA invertase Pin-like site-specific DNA recombinase
MYGPVMVPTIMYLQRLNGCGVGFHSYTEPHLATDSELVRNILLATLASLAKVEAQKIGERTKASKPRVSTSAARRCRLRSSSKSLSGSRQDRRRIA